MVVSGVEETASMIRRVVDEMLSLNTQQLIGSDCITADRSQVHTDTTTLCPQKKEATKRLAVTLSNLNRF